MTKRFLILTALAFYATSAFAQDAALAKTSGRVTLRAAGTKEDIPGKAGDSLLYGD